MPSADTTSPGPDAGEPHKVSCTCAMLRRTARRLTQAYDKALKPAGLKLTQYSVLANVTREPGLSITDLAERMAMDRTTLTRNLRPLERAGWVRLAPGPDQRSRAVEITAAGQAVFDKALPLWREAERAFRRGLGRDETTALHRLLERAVADVG